MKKTLLAVALAATLGLAAPASAHDAAESTSPAQGASLAAPPGEVSVTFSNPPLGIGSSFSVKDASGTEWADGSVRIVDNVATQKLRSGGPAGAYTVAWRVVSSDSHPIEGTFTFTAASGSAPAGGLEFGSESAQSTGETTNDAVDLFGFSPVAMPMALAASGDPLKFGDRFHGLIDGVGSGSQRSSAGGSSGRGAQKALADCCEDPATQHDDPLLTAPTLLADGASGPAPETGAWALMILGFAMSGLVLRGERRRWA